MARTFSSPASGPSAPSWPGLCARRHLSVIAIDRSDSPHALTPAGAFDDEAMRLFQFIGIAPGIESICRVSDRMEFVTAAGEVLMDFPAAEAPTISGWRKNIVVSLFGSANLKITVKKGEHRGSSNIHP